MAVLGPGSGLGSPAWCLAREARSPSHRRRPRDHGRHLPPRRCDHRLSASGVRDVSAERVVSGSGLENLYRAVVAVDGVDAPQRDAAAITTAALNGVCPTAREALELFCAMLGTIAGNVALTLALAVASISRVALPRGSRISCRVRTSAPGSRTKGVSEPTSRPFRQASSCTPLPRSSA